MPRGGCLQPIETVVVIGQSEIRPCDLQRWRVTACPSGFHFLDQRKSFISVPRYACNVAKMPQIKWLCDIDKPLLAY
jgi:hypothetical protein